MKIGIIAGSITAAQREFQDKCQEAQAGAQSRLMAAIIWHLSNKGYSFDSQEEQMAFFRERCTVTVAPSGVSTLFVDDTVKICSWEDTITSHTEGYEAKFTMNLRFIG